MSAAVVKVHPYWHAMLCAETVERAAEQMRAVLDGQYFTMVICNSYSEETERFSAVEVYPSQRLTTPVRVSDDTNGYCGLHWGTGSLSMGVHTKAATQTEGRNGRPYDYVSFNFEGRQFTIDHYAPAGYRLRWIFAVEDHDEEATS